MPQKPLGSRQGRWPGSTALPGPLAAHACTAALPAKAGACHSLGVSKAPFASPQKPLGSRQGRWPGSTALPGTFGCTCLHRSLACRSRCTSLFKRIESAVCQPSKASPQPAGPLARLHSPSRDLWLHMPAPQPCLPKPVRVTLYRRFESAVCPPSQASRQPAGLLARLHSPSRDLWLHMPKPQPCMSLFRHFESAVCQPSKASRRPAGPLARLHSPSRDLAAHACTAALPATAHSLGVSKAPLARLQRPLGSRQGRWPGSTALPGPLAAHACTAALPAKAGACHSLAVSKAPFASLRKPLGSRQGRWPGSTALPGTFGCKCLHRSLACQSRCMSLFRRFESAVCQPSKASRQPAGPLARLHSPSRDLWLQMPAPQPCLPKPVHVTL